MIDSDIKERNSVLESLISSSAELSSLPQTLAQVIALSQNEYASIDDLGHVIERDPGLSARVLRAANSPHLGQAREITRIPQAVQALGFRSVLSFALTASVYKLTGALKGRIDRTRFWRHSLETAVASRLLAKLCGRIDADEAFTAGLLHDIGMLVFDVSNPDRYFGISREVEKKGADLIELEISEWGTNHAAAGAFLLRQWKIPENICQAVAQHHALASEIEKGSLSDLSTCVNMANAISRHRVFNNSGTAMAHTERRVAALEKLDIGNDRLATLEGNLAEEFQIQAQYMEIEVGDTESLTLEANRALYAQYLIVEELLRTNRRLQEQITKEQAEKQTLRSLRAISGAYNHYLNNASAIIQGHAQLLQVRADKGEITDSNGCLERSLNVVLGAVQMISAVLAAIEELTHIETTQYHENFEILDIEVMVAERKREFEELAASLKASSEKSLNASKL